MTNKGFVKNFEIYKPKEFDDSTNNLLGELLEIAVNHDLGKNSEPISEKQVKCIDGWKTKSIFSEKVRLIFLCIDLKKVSENIENIYLRKVCDNYEVWVICDDKEKDMDEILDLFLDFEINNFYIKYIVINKDQIKGELDPSLKKIL